MVAIPLKYQFLLLSLSVFLIAACTSCSDKEKKAAQDNHKKTMLGRETKTPTKNFKAEHVPVLCYHAIRNINKDDSANQKTYSVSPANFEMQIKALAANGYTSITPDELKDFYTSGKPLPEKPIVISFDDGRKEQYTIASKTLDKYHFKGVFFIMTVSIGKDKYMSKNEIKSLSEKGHIIGCHTWDHNKVTGFKKADWQIQLTKPKQQLENITHKPVTCFSYPFGVWNRTAADSVKSHGFTTAFIVYGSSDANIPLHTLQRIIVKNSWSTKDFLNTIEKGK